MKKMLLVVAILFLFAINVSKADECIGGNSQVTVSQTAEGQSVTFNNPLPPNAQMSVFAGLVNCTMDGNPFKAYCIDLFHTVNLPDAGYTETCQYAEPRVQYILNNYYPLKSSYPGKLADNNNEAAAINLVLWSYYDNVVLTTITNATIRNRAIAIRDSADLKGIATPAIITFSFEPGYDFDGFFIKTLDENGDPISVQNIILSISEGQLSEDTITTDSITGISPEIFVSGATNGSTITARATMKYAHGRVVDGINPAKQTLAIAFPVFGKMATSIQWGALPVELSSFTSMVNGRNVHLNWTTSTETNNSGFEVERTITGANTWTKIGFVSGNGTSATPHSYSYSDRLQTGNYSYRLKQIDYNGNYEYFDLNSEVIIGIPDKFILSQNYPNPFNPSTKINYAIPFEGKVSLTIFDNSGKEVAKLVNNNLTGGYYTANFDASSLASGVYYYRLDLKGQTNFSETKRMMLVK